MTSVCAKVLLPVHTLPWTLDNETLFNYVYRVYYCVIILLKGTLINLVFK